MLEICNAISIIGFGAPPKAQNSLSHRRGSRTHAPPRAYLGRGRLAAASHQEEIIWLSFLSFSLSFWLLCLFSGLQRMAIFRWLSPSSWMKSQFSRTLGPPLCGLILLRWVPLLQFTPRSSCPRAPDTLEPLIGTSAFTIGYTSFFFSHFLFFATLRGSEVAWIVKHGDMRRSKGREEARKQKEKKMNYWIQNKPLIFHMKIVFVLWKNNMGQAWKLC